MKWQVVAVLLSWMFSESPILAQVWKSNPLANKVVSDKDHWETYHGPFDGQAKRAMLWCIRLDLASDGNGSSNVFFNSKPWKKLKEQEKDYLRAVFNIQSEWQLKRFLGRKSGAWFAYADLWIEVENEEKGKEKEKKWIPISMVSNFTPEEWEAVRTIRAEYLKQYYRDVLIQQVAHGLYMIELNKKGLFNLDPIAVMQIRETGAYLVSLERLGVINFPPGFPWHLL